MKKLAKDEWVDEDEEENFDLDEEDEEEVKPKKLTKSTATKEEVVNAIKKQVNKPTTQVREVLENADDEGEFEAYHFTERHGIRRKGSTQSAGEDIHDILAIILNKLEKLEKSIG